MRIGAAPPTLLLAVLALGACSGPREVEESASPAPTESPAASPAAEEPGVPAVLTLADVIRLSENAPVNRAARAAVERAAGNLAQAGLSPNPSLQLAAERIPIDDVGEGPLKYNVRAFQWIETAGRRAKRSAAADLRVREAEWEERIVNITIARTACGAHQEALAADRLVAVREAALRAAEALLALTAEMVEAGREPETALPPIRARVGRLRIEREDESARRRRALADLESVLSLAAGSVEGVRGELLLPVGLPEAEDATDGNPEVARRGAAVDAERARSEAAEAKKYPNVGVGIGYEYQDLLEEGSLHSFGFYLEVPLPFFDRNQGEIRESVAAARRAEALTAAERQRVAAEYALTLSLIRTGAANLATWRGAVVPALGRDRELKEAAYEAGRSSRAEVLAARLAELASTAAAVEEEAKLAALTLDALALLGRPPGGWLAKPPPGEEE